MNYNKHYDLLINRAKNRLIEGYCEKHHIIPRCFGGDDSVENLVKLTAREHFITHLLLYKMQTAKRKIHQMLTAVVMMKGKTKNSKMYEAARITFGKIHSESISGENHPMYGTSRCGVDNPFYGKTHSDKTRTLLSNARQGMIVAKDTRTNEVIWVTADDFNEYDYYVGSTNGDKLSEETKKKISQGLKNKPILTCPHCGVSSRGNMKRYHFDNCKKYILANDFSIAKI